MAGKAFIFIVCMAFSCNALSATKGKTSRQYFTCDSTYKLWKVIWFGVGKVGQADVMEGQTNLNWTVKADRVSTPSGSMAPATNLRWYRVRSHAIIPFTFEYTSMCWMPQQRCGSQRTR